MPFWLTTSFQNFRTFYRSSHCALPKGHFIVLPLMCVRKTLSRPWLAHHWWIFINLIIWYKWLPWQHQNIACSTKHWWDFMYVCAIVVHTIYCFLAQFLQHIQFEHWHKQNSCKQSRVARPSCIVYWNIFLLNGELLCLTLFQYVYVKWRIVSEATRRP